MCQLKSLAGQQPAAAEQLSFCCSHCLLLLPAAAYTAVKPLCCSVFTQGPGKYSDLLLQTGSASATLNCLLLLLPLLLLLLPLLLLIALLQCVHTGPWQVQQLRPRQHQCSGSRHQ
jgi:hypothetical protein